MKDVNTLTANKTDC